MADADVLDFPEPDGNAAHIRDRVIDAIECVEVARRMLATDQPDGPHAVRLHATTCELSQLVFNLLQDFTRPAALEAVETAGNHLTVDGVEWWANVGRAGRFLSNQPPEPGPSGMRRTFD